MTGIILMIIGIIVFVVGIIIYNSSRNKEVSFDSEKLDKVVEIAIADGVLTDNEREIIKKTAIQENQNYEEVIKDAEDKLSELKIESETELIDYNKKKGDDFEKFIVQKFNNKYFRVKEWAGDKYVNGIYADTTLQPDLLMEFKLRNKIYNFSVECKWRQGLYNGGIEIAKKEQLFRYQEYEKNKNIPVFIAVGIGGKANSPEKLYIIPLKLIKNNFMILKDIAKYEKDVSSYFYFDIEKQLLN